MGLLVQVVKVAVGELTAVGGHLHGEARGDAVGALAVHQSVVLEVPRSEDGGDLATHTSETHTVLCDQKCRMPYSNNNTYTMFILCSAFLTLKVAL